MLNVCVQHEKGLDLYTFTEKFAWEMKQNQTIVEEIV